MRILVVEDDRPLAEGLKQGLQQLDYTVDLAHSAEMAESIINGESFDLALVDVGLPKADGLTFIKKLRAQGSDIPVLILSALDGMEETIRGLDAGADDYLAKPYRLPEVAARIRALTRRKHSIRTSKIQHNKLTLDLAARQITIDGLGVDLTRREWSILELLLHACPAVVSKEELVQKLSGWDQDMTLNAIEVHVSRLRNKVAAGGVFIRTVRGIGYRVDPAEY